MRYDVLRLNEVTERGRVYSTELMEGALSKVKDNLFCVPTGDNSLSLARILGWLSDIRIEGNVVSAEFTAIREGIYPTRIRLAGLGELREDGQVFVYNITFATVEV